MRNLNVSVFGSREGLPSCRAAQTHESICFLLVHLHWDATTAVRSYSSECIDRISSYSSASSSSLSREGRYSAIHVKLEHSSLFPRPKVLFVMCVYYTVSPSLSVLGTACSGASGLKISESHFVRTVTEYPHTGILPDPDWFTYECVCVYRLP